MINFVIGRPGGGKSMFAVTLIVEELRNGRRNIATNVALDIPSMAEKLHERYGETFDMLRRIRILTPDECLDFWNHPQKGIDCTGRVIVAEGKGRKIEAPDFSVRNGDPGTLFVIDEFHTFFNARQWQQTGEDALYYASQHRKLGDDVIPISQAHTNVDKQFRVIAQDYTSVRNLSVERWGIFAMPDRMLVQRYLTCPTGVNDKPMETSIVKIDTKFIGKMYFTAAGVGLIGTLADTGRKKKGVPWWSVILLAILFVAAVGYVPKLVFGAIGKAILHPVNNSITNAPAAAPVAPVPAPEPVAPMPAPRQPKAATIALEPSPEPVEPRRILGTAHAGNRVTIYMEDGEEISGQDKRVGQVTSRGALIDGVWHRIMTAKEAAAEIQPTAKPQKRTNTPPPSSRLSALANP